MLFRGKIKAIGKDGVQFEHIAVDTVTKLSQEMTNFISETSKALNEVRTEINASKIDRLELRTDIAKINVKLAELNDAQLRHRRELLRTQILVGAVSYETKLHLYDEYKKMGGNGWLDEYMGKLKERHANGEV